MKRHYLRNAIFAVVFCVFAQGVANAKVLLELKCAPEQNDAKADKYSLVNVRDKSWEVTHVEPDGSRFDRAEQYNIIDTSGPASISWIGQLSINNYVIMRGEIVYSYGKFEYIESLYDARRGTAKLDEIRHACVALAPPVFSPAAARAQASNPGITELLLVKDPQRAANTAIVSVYVNVNGAETFPFIVDSGADPVSIPEETVNLLVKEKAIDKDKDFGEVKTYQTPSGLVKTRELHIRSLTVGKITVENVEGVVGAPHSTLLLGQSFLRRFVSYTIDNNKQVLLLGALRGGYVNEFHIPDPNPLRTCKTQTGSCGVNYSGRCYCVDASGNQLAGLTK